MHPARYLALIGLDETERARRDDEAWRAWHRRPDAAPAVDGEAVPALGGRADMGARDGGSAMRRLRVASVVGRVAGWSLLSRR